ncbi:PAS domain-containing protein, partial [Desulfovibrio sp. OttesenSCG-928-M16]|nr:PAS domain-containing protein [Desulfovibrio sp. OttesenSCG-928-M16]
MDNSGRHSIVPPELFQKFRAGKITPWRLVIKDDKMTLTTDRTGSELLGQADGPLTLDWADYLNMVHPEERQGLSDCVNEMRSNPSLHHQMEYRIWNASQNCWRWLFVFGTADSMSDDGKNVELSGGAQDIQESKELQREREREHSFNMALIEGLPGPYLVADPKGRIKRWNRHFAEAFTAPGLQDDTFIWTDIFAPHEREVATKAMAGAAEGESRSFKAHALLKDGSQKLFFCQVRLFSDAENSYLLAMLFDVSEAEQAENRLEQATSNLETVVMAANLGTWDWTLDTGEVIYNQTWADIAGVKLEDIQGRVEAWTDALLPEDLSKAMAAVDAHVRGETPLYEAEFRMRRPDGRIIWAVDRGRMVKKLEDGTGVRLLGVLQDISAEKERQFELERSKNHLDMLMRETHFGAWDWNLATDTIEYSDSYFSILGYTPEDVDYSFKFWAELIHPHDLELATKALNDMIEGRSQSYECEVRMRRKDGSYIWIVDSGYPVEWDEKGRVMRAVGGHFDIHKRKQQEQAQQAALQTIALQKAALEETVSERTTLLEEARQRIHEIITATGQSRDNPLPHAPDEESGGFAESLRRTIDLIMTTMWWYKAVIDSIPFPIFVTDMEDRWTYLNKPALSTIGVDDLAEVRGKAAQAWGEERQGQDLADGQRSMRTKTGFINRYNSRLGRFFQGQGSPLSSQLGERIGHIEAVQDVTEVHAANQRMRIMLDSMPLACTFWKSDLTMADCNLAAPRLFGFNSKQEFRGHFFDIMAEDMFSGKYNADNALKVLGEAFKDGYKRREWIFRLLDGRLMPAEITMVRVTFGNDLIVLAYMRDLTELKTKEDELERERQLLVKIMDSSPVCFVIVVDGLIRFATPYALEFFGASLDNEASACFADKQEGEAFFGEVLREVMVNWRVVAMRSARDGVREMLANAFQAEYFGEPCVMSWFLDV